MHVLPNPEYGLSYIALSMHHSEEIEFGRQCEDMQAQAKYA